MLLGASNLVFGFCGPPQLWRLSASVWAMWRGRTGLLALALWPRRCRCEEDVGPGGEMAALWRRPWQADWDGRAPVEKMKAVGRVRHLIFVRHGQYDLDGEEHGLTELGKRQSERLAQRLDAERQVTRKDRYGATP